MTTQIELHERWVLNILKLRGGGIPRHRLTESPQFPFPDGMTYDPKKVNLAIRRLKARRLVRVFRVWGRSTSPSYDEIEIVDAGRLSA